MKNLIFIASAFLAVSCIEINKLDHQTPATAQNVTFNRQMQRVVRYDCQGHLTSDQIEEVQGPTQDFYMSSNFTENLIGFKAINQTTNSKKGSIEYDQGIFTMDLAEKTDQMKAVEGINQIAWAFTFCTERDEAQKCIRKEVTESGVAYLNVHVGEVLLEGRTKIKCKQ